MSKSPAPVSPEPTPATWQKTACILCECNCGLEVQVVDRTLAKIRGDKDHPASEGYTCEKPLRLNFYQNRRDRITSPLRRRTDGSYEEIDWATAISEIAAKLGEIKQAHGGDKIFFYGGGGQGNHLGSTYMLSLRAALGSKYYSNALAQEKTGEMFVDGKLYGGHTKGDFEHSEVVVFVGKNPWQSHSFPRTRPVLKQIAADPDRAMIVLDPRKSETAKMADFHLQIKPGTDAYCLAALTAVLVQEDLVNHDFLRDHTTGSESIIAELSQVSVPDYATRCGVDEELIRTVARRIAAAKTVTTYEDLGIQQSRHSTLSSYLNKMLWILTGNFARPGTMYLHSSFAPLTTGSGGARKPTSPPSRLSKLGKQSVNKISAATVSVGATAISRAVPTLSRFGATDQIARQLLEFAADSPFAASLATSGAGGRAERRTPVTGARIISGLVPCNSITEEILTDHPDRLRAMWIDAVNPAHSLPDTARWAKALRELELVVVIDVAMTETAQLADYVLPASTQFEKWEATFFNFEFPRNVFQLRPPLMEPTPGTLGEPEIYARVIRELGTVDSAIVDRLAHAAKGGRNAFALAFFSTIAANPQLAGVITYLLYETLGPTLRANARAASSLWAVAHLCALSYPDGVRRAGYTGDGFEPGEKLFDAVLNTPAGVTFTVDGWDQVWKYVKKPDHRISCVIPELLDALADLRSEASEPTNPEFPLMLSAGERRAFSANTIIRDPDWRRRERDGALRVSADDALELGLEPGGAARLSTPTGSATVLIEISDMMRSGHVSLPNGYGLSYPDADGNSVRTGIAPNELTSHTWRDPIAGTPWHKNVPARLEAIAK